MKRTISIEIDCGDLTCYSEPGKHCKYLRTFRLGTEWCCSFFARLTTSGKIIPLEETPDGWLKRDPECMNAEVARNPYVKPTIRERESWKKNATK